MTVTFFRQKVTKLRNNSIIYVTHSLKQNWIFRSFGLFRLKDFRQAIQCFSIWEISYANLLTTEMCDKVYSIEVWRTFWLKFVSPKSDTIKIEYIETARTSPIFVLLLIVSLPVRFNYENLKTISFTHYLNLSYKCLIFLNKMLLKFGKLHWRNR